MVRQTQNDSERELQRIREKYAYMDGMPLANWLWEMIRRSNDYKMFYEKWLKLHDKPLKKWTVTDHEFFDEHLKWYCPFFPKDPDEEGEPILNHGISRLFPILTANLAVGFEIDDSGELVEVHHPRIFKGEKNPTQNSRVGKKAQGHPFGECKADKGTTYFVEDRPIPPKGNGISLSTYSLEDQPIDILYQHQAMKNIVMALIDISAPENIDDILKSLKKQILFWKKTLKIQSKRSAKTPKKRSNKLLENASIWKSYLIIYDLVCAGKSYNTISDVLSLLDNFYSDVKNIENHYKNALALINGGYREYM
jgi:hypothetical protein